MCCLLIGFPFPRRWYVIVSIVTFVIVIVGVLTIRTILWVVIVVGIVIYEFTIIFNIFEVTILYSLFVKSRMQGMYPSMSTHFNLKSSFQCSIFLAINMSDELRWAHILFHTIAELY